MERNRKWKIPHIYRSRKLKVKLWWVGGSSRKKKEGIFCTVCFVRRKFFLTFLLTSQFIVYWIHFQNIHIHTFTYQKTLLHTLLLFIFKISKSLQCILNYWELLMLNAICEVSSKYKEEVFIFVYVEEQTFYRSFFICHSLRKSSASFFCFGLRKHFLTLLFILRTHNKLWKLTFS